MSEERKVCRHCERPQCSGGYGWPCGLKREEAEREYYLRAYGTETPTLVRSYWD